MSDTGTSILLVDDNQEVREGLARVLRGSGYTVATAQNGLEALAALEGNRYRAVICDIMMPVMDGIRLYQLLEARHPDVTQHVLFVSAWFDDPDVQSFLTRTGRPVLQKPFEIADLLQAVRQVAA